VIVMPLKPSRISEVEVRYSPGSYFRSYRPGDQLRIAHVVLHHKTTNRSIELDALIVVDLAAHRGNCGTIVSNIVVVKKIDKLEKQANVARDRLRQLDEQSQAVAQVRQEREQAAQRLVDRRDQLAELAADKETSWEALEQGLHEYQQAQRQDHARAQALKEAALKEVANEARRGKMREELKRVTEERKALDPQKTIRQLDVALDSVLTAVKLAAAFLITFVLREYLGSKPMTAAAFVAHVLSIRGRREVRPGEERIVFYKNPRDPEISEVLAKACARLNERNLQRGGRRLSYTLEAAPKPAPLEVAPKMPP